MLVPFGFVKLSVMSRAAGRVQLPLKSGLPFGSRGAGAFMSTLVTLAVCAGADTWNKTTVLKASASVRITAAFMARPFVRFYYSNPAGAHSQRRASIRLMSFPPSDHGRSRM